MNKQMRTRVREALRTTTPSAVVGGSCSVTTYVGGREYHLRLHGVRGTPNKITRRQANAAIARTRREHARQRKSIR